MLSHGRMVLAVCIGGGAEDGLPFVHELDVMGVKSHERVGRLVEGVTLFTTAGKSPRMTASPTRSALSSAPAGPRSRQSGSMCRAAPRPTLLGADECGSGQGRGCSAAGHGSAGAGGQAPAARAGGGEARGHRRDLPCRRRAGGGGAGLWHETIAPVAKIVGPGNAYVAAAKRLVFGKVGIDMIAGPSEVLILADKTGNPEWIAGDLLAQAEHDTSAQSILITDEPRSRTRSRRRSPGNSDHCHGPRSLAPPGAISAP